MVLKESMGHHGTWKRKLIPFCCWSHLQISVAQPPSQVLWEGNPTLPQNNSWCQGMCMSSFHHLHFYTWKEMDRNGNLEDEFFFLWTWHDGGKTQLFFGWWLFKRQSVNAKFSLSHTKMFLTPSGLLILPRWTSICKGTATCQSLAHAGLTCASRRSVFWRWGLRTSCW